MKAYIISVLFVMGILTAATLMAYQLTTFNQNVSTELTEALN